MANDSLLLRWLRALGLGRPPGPRATSEDDTFDRRLTDIEREQRNIDARLSLLERQADPRDWQGHG